MAMSNGVVNLFKRDPRELQLYTSLKTAQQRVPDWPGSLPVPVLCTVGMQSAGKTTFIEALIGFRIGTTCAGTGTRCPVRYILKDGEPHFAVSGKRLKERCEIQMEVERHMESLALKPKESDRFSREELKVEITDHGLPLLDMTDLPGLKAKGEGADEIKAVVRFYVQSQSARPVVLVKATESVETQADVELLRDVGIDAKKGNATFVVNYFNDQLYKFSKTSELNEYCRAYAREYGSVYFCMLIYSQDAKDQKDRLDFAGQSVYYRDLPIKEKETFDQKAASLTRDDDLNAEDVINRFGVVPAINNMQSIIRDFIVKEGRRYADKLRPLEEQYDSNLRIARKELSKCNPDYVKEQRERYVERWGEIVRDIQTCKKRLDLTKSFDPMDCGMTFQQELAKVCDLNDGVTLVGKCEPSFAEKLPGMLKRLQQPRQPITSQSRNTPWKVPQVEDLYLGAMLTADASLVRLNDTFDYIISKEIAITPVPENEARAISGYAPGGMPGAFDCLKVVKEVATRPLAEVVERLWPMMVHVRAIYEHALDYAHTTMKDHPGYTEAVRDYVTGSYSKLLMSKIREQYDNFREVIYEKTTYLPAEIHERYSVVPAQYTSTSLGYAMKTLGFALAIGLPPLVLSHGWHAKWLHGRRCLCICSGAAVGLGLQHLNCSSTVRVNMSAVNQAAAEYCHRLKAELCEQFRSKVARSLFYYLKQGIIADVRDDLRQQIREVDAKRIDEDTKAHAAELRTRVMELERSLTYIRKVLEDIELLNSSMGGLPRFECA